MGEAAARTPGWPRSCWLAGFPAGQAVGWGLPLPPPQPCLLRPVGQVGPAPPLMARQPADLLPHLGWGAMQARLHYSPRSSSEYVPAPPKGMRTGVGVPKKQPTTPGGSWMPTLDFLFPLKQLRVQERPRGWRCTSLGEGQRGLRNVGSAAASPPRSRIFSRAVLSVSHCYLLFL